jgi:signal transduction histidine kinase
MEKVIIDWAVWDDAYQYASDGDSDFVDSNITADAFAQLEMNVMLIIDKSGKVLNASGYDIATGEQVVVPDDVINTLAHDPLLLAVDMDTQTKSGIVDLAGKKMMVASATILKGNFDGPPNGAIIQARYLDMNETDNLSQTIGLPVSVYDYNASDLPEDVTEAKADLKASMPIVVQTLADNAQSGYAVLNNLKGESDLIFKIDMPRSVYQQGKQTLSYFIILVIILGLVFGGAILFALEASVLARMASLSRTVVEISESNDLHKRVAEGDKDELSSLAGVINKLLNSTENSQTELKHRLEELAILQNQKDRFFTHAAHEFRTPLANFRTHLYLARKRPDRADEYLGVLDKVTRQMTDLVEDIFDVARYGEHSIELHELFTSLGQLLKDICDDQRPFAITKGIDWEETFASEKLNVMVDNARITQAISKIINYVISFTPPSSKIKIQLAQSQDHAILRIGSSMMNVRYDQAVQIFQPFFRTSEGSTVTTGLGLTIAKEIIERHGGRIQFESNDEKGGTFIIELLLMNEVDDTNKQTVLQDAK